MNTLSIVFSGFNQRAVIAYLRTLEANDLPYAIIAKSNKDTIFLTEYKGSVVKTRKSVPLVLDDLIASIAAVKKKITADRYLIIPSAEALNRFLLENRSEFKKLKCIIPLVHKDLYEQISNKYSFSRLCEQHDIQIPQEFSIEDKFIFPCVAKPKKYFSSTTGESLYPIIIKNKSEFNAFEKKYSRKDFYFQEYIAGKSLYLLYYVHRSGKIYSFSQKNIAQQSGGKSIVAAVSSTFHCSDESKKYKNLFRDLDFYGLVMIEVKQRKKVNYMIEANPRLWGPSQLFVDSGVNLFLALLHDFKVLSSVSKFNESEQEYRYFWFGGIIENFKQQKELAYHQDTKYTLMKQLPSWIKADIYRRKDTINIFEKELI